MGFQDDQQMRDALRKPFGPGQIGKLPRGGRSLDYVGHAAVTDRLNRIDPGWNYEIVERVEVEHPDGRHLIAIIGAITIGGKTMIEAGDVDRPGRYGEELKLAIGDFIRRGAMRFGVALDLWSKEDLAQESQTKSKSSQRRRTQEYNPDVADGGETPEVSPTDDSPPSDNHQPPPGAMVFTKGDAAKFPRLAGLSESHRAAVIERFHGRIGLAEKAIAGLADQKPETIDAFLGGRP